VRNLSGFARFLPIAAIHQGQALNVSNIAREAGVAKTTVTGYFDILEETLLCFRLTGFLHGPNITYPKSFWKWIGRVQNIRVESGDPGLSAEGRHNGSIGPHSRFFDEPSGKNSSQKPFMVEIFVQFQLTL